MWGMFSKEPKIEDTLFNITMTAKQLEKMSSKEEKRGDVAKKRMVDVSDATPSSTYLSVCLSVSLTHTHTHTHSQPLLTHSRNHPPTSTLCICLRILSRHNSWVGGGGGIYKLLAVVR
jgi:hypothetical protein